MKKLLFFAALLLTVFAACKKDDPTPTEQAENLLIGTWNYTQKGEAYPTGSQQTLTNVQAGNTDEFKASGEWITVLNGTTVTYHWQMVDPNTLKKVETDENFKIVELTSTKLTLSRPNIKNGVQGEVFFYYTK